MEEPNSPYFRDQVDDDVDDSPQDRELVIVEGESMSLRAYKKRRV